jgi:hypothetical protein
MAEEYAEPSEGMSPGDLSLVAQYVKSEFETRKSRRSDLEIIWKEVDRQVAMLPMPRLANSGKKND